MDNYDAFKRMNKTQLETFLDQVYLTGVNSGMYAATLPNDSEEQAMLLDENLFSEKWVSSEAEQATMGAMAEDGDAYILDALATAVLRGAGISVSEEEE